MTSRGKSGISSVVAALFTVVIVFFAHVPTFLFTQSLYSILSREVNERRYFEIDRSSEDLEVFVMQIGNRPNLKVVNTGPISLVVVRVWAYRVGSVDAGHTLPPNGPCYSQPVLPPVIFIAAISGLVAGKISTSRVAGGFVHAVILSAVSLIAIWIAGTVSVQLFKLPSVS